MSALMLKGQVVVNFTEINVDCLTNLTTVAFLKKCKHSYSIKYNLCLSTLSTDQ